MDAARAPEPPVAGRPGQAWADDRALVALADGSGLWVDTQRATVLQRWPALGAVHAAPQFAPDGRHIFAGTRDGWLLRLNADNGTVQRVRVGQALAGLALSSDGRWLVAGLEVPAEVQLLDDQLRPRRQWRAASRDGKQLSAVAAVLDLPARRSVLVTLRDFGEIWEISYDERAEDIYDGLVHDFRMGEGVPLRGFLNPRRGKLPAPLWAPTPDADQFQVLGTAGSAGGSHLVNLDVRKRVPGYAGPALLPTNGALAWRADGRSLMLVAQPGEPAVRLLDLNTLSTLATLRWPAGPARGISGHPQSDMAWVATGEPGITGLMGVDKRQPQRLTPVALPGTARHAAAASADGCRLLLAIEGEDGFLLVLDSRNAREINRLSLRHPVGVWTAAPTGPAAADCGAR